MPMDQGRGILIRVRNVPQLVSQQGAVETLAQRLAPGTVEKKALSTIRDQLSSGLKEKGVDAELTIVSPANYKADSSNIWFGIAAALGVGVAGYVGYRVIKRKK